MTTPWSDTPPSGDKPGWYHCKPRDDKDERPFYRHREFFVVDGVILMEHEAKAMYRFGTRVLDAEDTIKLTAEVERLRAENEELRERLTVDDLGELERYRSPLDAEPMRPEPNDDDFPTIPFEVVQKLKCVRAEELDQLRAAAAELAEIKRAWGMAAKDL